MTEQCETRLQSKCFFQKYLCNNFVSADNNDFSEHKVFGTVTFFVVSKTLSYNKDISLKKVFLITNMILDITVSITTTSHFATTVLI